MATLKGPNLTAVPDVADDVLISDDHTFWLARCTGCIHNLEDVIVRNAKIRLCDCNLRQLTIEVLYVNV